MNSSLADSILQHRPFVLFWFARVATTLAFQMLSVAIGWQLYALTGDPFDLGLVGLAQFVPAACLVLVVGQVADRFDRRTILCVCQTVQAAAAAALLVGTATGHLGKTLILAVAVVLGGCRAFELTTQQALLPNLVPLPLVPRAVAGSAAANQTASIVGPAIGGFLYAAGPTWVYGTCVVLFVVTAVLMVSIRIERVAPRREPVSLELLFAGFAFIRRHPVVLGAISLDLFAVLIGSTTALLPGFARDILGTGPWGLGLLRAAPAFGALSMSLALTRWPLGPHAGRVMLAAVAVFGLATIAFALSTSFVLALAALAVLGAADVVSVVIRMTLVQLETPDEMRGRVSAVNAFFIGASNQLGEFRAGAAAALIGPVPAVIAGGIGTLLVVALWTRLFPELARVEKAP
jgi:MFS family permease